MGNTEQMREMLQSQRYRFLRENPALGNHILILAPGGSYAYGMEQKDSDVDIRGIAANSRREILSGTDFEQIVEENTDTTVYSFNKAIKLLSAGNPNMLEILGCRPEQYLYLSEIGKELLDHQKLFLSKLCIQTFGGYASAQLRRLENKAARLTSQAKNEAYILKSIENAQYNFMRRYYPLGDQKVKLYIDKTAREGYDTEIFMDISLRHYPLRDWAGMWNEMRMIVNGYAKIGKRNQNAISRDKLGKHMAHLLRLYMMCIDILEKEEIITYRSEEHELLMEIRRGAYLDKNRQPVSAFFDLLDEYEKRFDYACRNTALPELPDYDRICEFKMHVNEQMVLSGMAACSVGG